ncbi:hypothetical protein [Pseudarthrobacter sp. CCNWLW207]|uniref:hypothetical protein n=1 Tax=Pseudarthrobacter sp. CCNWLW207 TaxID=3127468 RepID=UPI003078A095
MSSHFLTRNPDNDPVCSCGFRPSILEEAAPAGRQWKARTDVLNHADALNEVERVNAPFLVKDARYPRAGVRQTDDGRWLLTCWDADRIVHVIEEPIFDDRVTAFDFGWLTIGACRQNGTNLNGWAAA